MIRSGHARATDVLPPLQAGNKNQLTVGPSSAFQVIVAPQKDPPADKHPTSPSKINANSTNRGPGRGNTSPTRPKQKTTPLNSDMRRENTTDQEIIDGIRADLRAKFALSLGRQPMEALGQSTTVVQEVTVDLQRLEDSVSTAGEESPSKFNNGSASAPDVGQVKFGEVSGLVGKARGNENPTLQQGKSERSEIPSQPAAEPQATNAFIAAHVSAIARQADAQTRTFSRLSAYSKVASRKSSQLTSPTRTPAQWLPSSLVPPPSSSALYRRGEDNSLLPPVNRGLTTIPSRQTTRHSVASSHRPRVSF